MEKSLLCALLPLFMMIGCNDSAQELGVQRVDYKTVLEQPSDDSIAVNRGGVAFANAGINNWSNNTTPDLWSKTTGITPTKSTKRNEGSYSAKVKKTSAVESGYFYSYLNSIKGRTEYKLSMDTFDRSSYNAKGYLFNIWYDGDRNMIGSINFFDATENTDRWETKTITVTSPANAVYLIMGIQVQNEGSSSGYVYLDNIVVETTEATGCPTDEHEEDGLCVFDLKEIPCDDLAPENGTSIIEDVMVEWNAVSGSWNQADLCAFSCNSGYELLNGLCQLPGCPNGTHDESGSCVNNAKTVSCRDVAPIHATSISENITINWSVVTETWDTAATCDYNCDSGYELSNGSCVVVDSPCTGISISNVVSEGGTYAYRYKGDVTGGRTMGIGFYGAQEVRTYDLTSSINNNYETCEQCVLVYEGDKTYYQSAGTLTIDAFNSDDDRMDLESAGRLNSITLVEVTIDDTTWQSTPVDGGACLEIETGIWNTMPTTCDGGTHLENGSCVSNTQSVSCRDAHPLNSGNIDANVSITWNNDGWSNPAVCDFSCNSGYERDGEQCRAVQVTTCTGLSVENIVSEGGDTAYRYHGDASGDRSLGIGFYGSQSVKSYDLASSINNNYKSCEQCVLIYEGDKTYYQTEGTLTLSELNDDSGTMTAESKGSLSRVKLVEVTIEDTTWESTPVTGGGCLEIETGAWDSMPGTNPVTKDDWTVMVYLDADNDLEAFGLKDFNEMEQGLYDAVQAGNSDITENLNLIVLIDRNRGYTSSATEYNGSDWSDTRLYRVKPDNSDTYFNSERLDDGGSGVGHVASLGEKNLGNPSTLSWFLEYGRTNFPAEHYAIVFWDHGGGARHLQKEDKDLKAVCWDEDSGDNPLYLDEIQDGIAKEFNSTDKIDVIGFDACIMSTVEVAYEFRNLADYLVASMNYEQGNGWFYTYIFGNMTGSRDESSLSGRSFAKLIVESYEYFIENMYNYHSGETLAATDLSKIINLKTEIDQFAAALYSEGKQSDIEDVRDATVNYNDDDYTMREYPYFDFQDFTQGISDSSSFKTSLRDQADDVIGAMQAVMVKGYGETGNGQSYYSDEESAANRGLSIFFSRKKSDYYYQKAWYTNTSGDYGYIDFADKTSDGSVNTWRELMDAWYK